MKLSRKQLQEAADYWNEQQGLPATSAEMILHLATFKKTRFEKSEKEIKFEVINDVWITEKQEKKLKEVFGDAYQWALEKISNYKLSKEVKYKSDYNAILGWVRECYHEKLTKSKINGANGLTASDIRMDQWARNKTNQNTGAGNGTHFAQSSEIKQD